MKHPVIKSPGLAVLVGVSLVAPAHAALVIDDFNIRQETYSAAALAGETVVSAYATDSGTIAGNRMISVSASDSTTAGAYSQTNVDSGYGKFYRDRTRAGSSTHTISWTAMTAYDLLSLSGASSINALTFQLDGFSGGQFEVSQLFTVQVGGAANNATFSGIGDAGTGNTILTYIGSIGIPDLSAVSQISLSTTIPFGRNPEFAFDNLTAVGGVSAGGDVSPVPEVTSSFTLLGLITGGLMLRRRTKHLR